MLLKGSTQLVCGLGLSQRRLVQPLTPAPRKAAAGNQGTPAQIHSGGLAAARSSAGSRQHRGLL